jgi:hypothetical protein
MMPSENTKSLLPISRNYTNLETSNAPLVLFLRKMVSDMILSMMKKNLSMTPAPTTLFGSSHPTLLMMMKITNAI